MTQSGHERAAFAAMHGPDLLYLILILGLGESPCGGGNSSRFSAAV